ncbi:hypothetical protein D3C80_1992840 [compost metagenome]
MLQEYSLSIRLLKQMVQKNQEMHNGDSLKVQQAHYGKLQVFLKDTELKLMQE